MFCYCAQSRRLARILTARYDAALAPANLTAAQFETLSVLAALGTAGGRVLAEHMALDKTTLSRNLKPLQDAGLVAAARDADDARNILYALTSAGRKRLAKATPLWQSAHDTSVTLLGTQAASSQRTLQRMAQSLR